MFKRVLFVYDESDVAERAFARTLRLAKAEAVDLAIVAVIGADEFALDAGAQTAFDCVSTQIACELGRLERRARALGMVPLSMISQGDPAREVARIAREWGADVIVTGERKRGSLRWPNRSLGRALLAQASCAVLVVR